MEYALQEEIGRTDFFVGREDEMAALLKWTEEAKTRVSKSRALLARRKKGKTALVQRLYNILYDNNDPMVVPFYLRVEEDNQDIISFAMQYYCTFISQFLAFQLRRPELVNKILPLEMLKELAKDDPVILNDIRSVETFRRTEPPLVWKLARQAPHRIAAEKDIRIIQIIDEFQYMNRYLFHDLGMEKRSDFCHSYMGTAESKIAPMLVTTSYIGWLTSIIGHMTSRFNPYNLHSLTDEEALATVYNYASLMNIPITDETAPYIAEVAGNDPFYISQIIRTDMKGLDLTSKAGVCASLQFETTLGDGFTANMWWEYIQDAFGRVNEKNAKKIVLYLAKYGNEERTRVQIKDDLKLELSDKELETRLYTLYMADLIARGSSYFRFKGLGDHVFAAVFRKIYGEEIDRVDPQTIREDFERELTLLDRQTNTYKGLAGEYKVMFHLLAAVNQQASLADIVFNHQPDFELNAYVSMHKDRLYNSHESSREIDIYARSTNEDGTDLAIEVKNWKQEVSTTVVNQFIDLKKDYAGGLKKKTGFVLYSENGFSEAQEDLMIDHQIMYTTPERLTAYLKRSES